jgi:hypothetical protein
MGRDKVAPEQHHAHQTERVVLVKQPTALHHAGRDYLNVAQWNS